MMTERDFCMEIMAMSAMHFEACELCKAESWRLSYTPAAVSFGAISIAFSWLAHGKPITYQIAVGYLAYRSSGEISRKDLLANVFRKFQEKWKWSLTPSGYRAILSTSE